MSIAAAVSGRFEARPLYAVLFVTLTLNSLSSGIALFFSDNQAEFTANLFGINAIIWFALFAILKLGLDRQQSRPIDHYDGIVIALSVAIMLLPVKAFSIFLLPVLAIYILWRSTTETDDRRMGIVALALSGPAFWGPSTQALFGQEITKIETKLLSAVTNLRAEGNVFYNIDGETLVIASGCSSFANVTLAFLLVTTFWQMMGLKNDRQLFGSIACAVVAVIIINSVRLAVLGFYPEQFEFWHKGTGGTYFMWLIFAVTALIAMIGVSRAASRQI